jgi:hypothetical protein
MELGGGIFGMWCFYNIKESRGKGWWSGSSGRVPVVQAWGPEFNFQYAKNKGKKLEEKCKILCLWARQNFLRSQEPWTVTTDS